MNNTFWSDFVRGFASVYITIARLFLPAKKTEKQPENMQTK